MKINILLTLFLGVCAANLYAATDRDALIQNQLNCFSQHKNDALTWSDICSMPDPSSSNGPATNDLQPQESPAPTLFNSRVNTFSLAEETYYYHYDEPDKIKRYTGVWSGGEGQYIFRPEQGSIFNNPVLNFYSLEGYYASAKNEKEGNIQRLLSDGSWAKVIQKDIPSYMFDLRALIGKDFNPLAYLRLTPYLGGGVRYKIDESGNHFNLVDTSGSPAIGYNSSDLYYYLPVGLNADLLLNNDYEISWNMEYDYLIKGYEDDRFSDGNEYTNTSTYGFSLSSDRTFALDHGFGLRASLKILKHFSLLDVYWQPYIEYWNINASKTAPVYETGESIISNTPKNSTIEIGCRLGVDF